MSGSNQQPFPSLSSRVTDGNGILTHPWRVFLQALWNRTGGSVSAAFAALNGSANEAFNAAPASTPTEVVPLEQMQAAIAASGVLALQQGTSTATGTINLGSGLDLTTADGLYEISNGGVLALNQGSISAAGNISIGGGLSLSGTTLETLSNAGVLSLVQGTVSASGTISIVGSGATLTSGTNGNALTINSDVIGVWNNGTLYPTLAAGTNITLSGAGDTLTVSASGGGGGSLYNRPPLSSFTWCNQAGVGASATDNTNGPLTITITKSVLNLSALTMPIPGSTWTIAAQLFSDQPGGNQFFGISLHDTLTGPALIFSVYAKSSAYIFRFNSPTSYNNSTSLSVAVEDPIWMKIVNDGTNLNYYFSSDGFDYVLAYSTTLTADLAAITHIGFAGTANNSASNFHTKLYNWSLTSP